jgi:PKD repeat protein
MPAGGLNCETGINFEPDSLNPLVVHITLDTTLYSGAAPHHAFFPGDWTIAEEYPHFVIDSLYASGALKVSYTFPAAGTYSVGNLSTIWDSTLMETRPCFMETFDTLTVPYTKYCHAGFLLDTSASNSDLLHVLNTSTPRNKNYTNTYFWDFGDGNTSNQPYPTHVFAAAGAYNVCVTLTSTDPFQNVCTSTFCDTIGVDSTGQIIYKNMAKGFTLQVIDPKSIALSEIGLQPTFSLYPNPASDVINIVSSSGSKNETTFSVFDIYGREVDKKERSSTKETEVIPLDISKLANGIYILKDASGYSVPFEVVR